MLVARFSSIVVSISLVIASEAGADPACPNLAPDHGSLGYRWRTGGDRCEGFFRSSVSGEALSVAFLIAGQLPSSSDSQIEIRSAGPNQAINVRAVALPLGTYYRMDATITPARPLHWPLFEVVQAGQLKSDDLGLYGWFGDAAQPTYVPIRATILGTPPVAGPNPVRLGIRANVPLELVTYNIADDVSCHFGSKPWKPLAADIPPGRLLVLPLPGDRPASCVSFRGRPPNSKEWEPLTARMRLR